MPDSRRQTVPQVLTGKDPTIPIITAQVYVAIIIGIVGSLPVILGELFAFLNPALHYSEKESLRESLYLLYHYL